MKTEMDFEELMDEAYGLPNGPAKLGMLEEAARVADVNGMEEEAYEARSEIVETATFCGYPMKALIAFSWQLGKFDQQPEEYDEETLMWSYKWILGKLSSFPEVSRDKIMELLEDFGQRFKSFGYSERSYWYYRFRISMDLGELEEAGSSYAKFRTMDRDFMSDCEACEQDEMMRYFILTGDDEKVLGNGKTYPERPDELCGDSASYLVGNLDATLPIGSDCGSRQASTKGIPVDQGSK